MFLPQGVDIMQLTLSAHRQSARSRHILSTSYFFPRPHTMDIQKASRRYWSCSITNVLRGVFRTTHASNYLALAGTLAKDRDRLLAFLEHL